MFAGANAERARELYRRPWSGKYLGRVSKGTQLLGLVRRWHYFTRKLHSMSSSPSNSAMRGTSRTLLTRPTLKTAHKDAATKAELLPPCSGLRSSRNSTPPVSTNSAVAPTIPRSISNSRYRLSMCHGTK